MYLMTDPYMGNVLLGNNWVQAYTLSAVKTPNININLSLFIMFLNVFVNV